jgi:hypothetical protein
VPRAEELISRSRSHACDAELRRGRCVLRHASPAGGGGGDCQGFFVNGAAGDISAFTWGRSRICADAPAVATDWCRAKQIGELLAAEASSAAYQERSSTYGGTGCHAANSFCDYGVMRCDTSGLSPSRVGPASATHGRDRGCGSPRRRPGGA